MSLRVSGFAFFKIFLTTLAGISSKRSVASSAIRLSMMLDASFSDRDWMIYCCPSISRFAKTSAAMLLGRMRKILRDSSSSISSMTAATSAAFMSSTSWRSFVYCFCSSRFIKVSLYSNVLSSITILHHFGDFVLPISWKGIIRT